MDIVWYHAEMSFQVHMYIKMRNGVTIFCSFFIHQNQGGVGSEILGRPDRSKIIDLPRGQINDPSSGKHYSLPFLPATPSSPSRILERLLELSWRPSQALDLPCALLLELHRHKDTDRGAALGAKIPRHRQEQLTQTLIVRLLKTHFFTPILDSEKPTEKNCVIDQT